MNALMSSSGDLVTIVNGPRVWSWRRPPSRGCAVWQVFAVA